MTYRVLMIAAAISLSSGLARAQNKLPTSRKRLVGAVQVQKALLQRSFSTRQQLAGKLNVHFKKLESPVTLDSRHNFFARGLNEIAVAIQGSVNPAKKFQRITFNLLDPRTARLHGFSVYFEGPVARQRRAIECEVRTHNNPADLMLRADGQGEESTLSLGANTTRVLSAVLPAGSRWWGVKFAKPESHFREELFAVDLKKCVVTPIGS